MRFTIEGFSQQRAVELGLTAEDLVILRWFVDFWPSPNMVKMEHDGKTYALVSYSGFIEQMPIIGCNKRTVARKFQRLVEANVLENVTIKQGGSFSVYRFGDNYDSLVHKCAPLSKSVQPVADSCTQGLYESVHTNTQYIKKPNTLNTDNITPHQNEGSDGATAKYDYQSFMDVYNNACKRLHSCRNMTEERKRAVRKFLKDFSMDQWKEVCENANKSNFLSGGGDRGWRANIDFLLRPDKAAAILEGYYDKEDDNDTARKDSASEIHYGVYL